MSNKEAMPRQLSKRAQRARYVVYVDNQAKSSYDVKLEAETEAARIKSAFSQVVVDVRDDDDNSVTQLGRDLAISAD